MRKMVVCIFAIGFLATQAFAELTPKFHGRFQHDPKARHESPITGEISLLFEGENFSLVQEKLDNPVMDETVYTSKEQALVIINRPDGTTQLSVVFKLQGAMHRWYFVLVTNGSEGNFSGPFYKVKETMDEILRLLKNGIDTIPSTWKAVGSAALMQH